MRFRMDVSALVDDPIPWPSVYTPTRAFIYALIQKANPDLSALLHDQGWGGSPLRPMGGTPVHFQRAKKQPGVYTVSESGAIWFGSPIPAIASALLAGAFSLMSETIRWGTCPLAVKGVTIDTPQGFTVGATEATFRTRTPIVVKHDSRWIFPEHPKFIPALTHNIAHKADLLGLPSDSDVTVEDVGSQRLFYVDGAPFIGHNMTVRVAAHPELLKAISSWGLGLNNNSGFGWLQ